MHFVCIVESHVAVKYIKILTAAYQRFYGHSMLPATLQSTHLFKWFKAMFMSGSNQIWNFTTDFHRTPPPPTNTPHQTNFTEIHPMKVALNKADGRTERQTSWLIIGALREYLDVFLTRKYTKKCRFCGIIKFCHFCPENGAPSLLRNNSSHAQCHHSPEA